MEVKEMTMMMNEAGVRLYQDERTEVLAPVPFTVRQNSQLRLYSRPEGGFDKDTKSTE
jgi:hypothetical protein